jgi:hypothetical protein
MDKQNLRSKRKEWLRRYIPAEIIGTTTALLGAWIVYTHTNSYVAGAAAGWVGEGVGFFGYFITLELFRNHKRYSEHSLWKRLSLTFVAASTNLIVEFLPAEIIDNFIIRPFAMYIVPVYIHPYPLGFLIGKFSADIIFYAIAIIGYEARKRWLHR